jgi:hypothetical protein
VTDSLVDLAAHCRFSAPAQTVDFPSFPAPNALCELERKKKKKEGIVPKIKQLNFKQVFKHPNP